MLLLALLLLSIFLVAAPCRPEGDPRPGPFDRTHGQRHRIVSPLRPQSRGHRPQPREAVPFARAVLTGTVRPGSLCLVCGLPKNQGDHNHA